MSYSKIDVDAFNNHPSGSAQRTDYMVLAQQAEHSYRFDDMCIFMRELVISSHQGPDLNHDERNLLSVAFKNAVGSRRSAWRNVSHDEKDISPASKALSKKIEDELAELCESVLDLLESVLIQHPQVTDESLVFYKKMAGDYYRYLAEFSSGDHLKTSQDASDRYYREAMDISIQIMSPIDPIRLGLALNYSVCLYEIMREKEEACRLAKEAYEKAHIQLTQVSPHEGHKDAKLILNLLRDNLTLWNSTGQQM